MKVFLSIVGGLVVIGGLMFMSYINAYNYGNQTENLIDATVKNNQNIYAITGKKVQEIAQVPGMMRDDQVAVINAAIEGRYGAGGSKAVFSMIQEMNPSVDAKLYTKIQEVIESSNNEFQAGQTTLIDIVRQYSTALGSFWTGMWLKQAGYPKIDLASKKYQPITTDSANSTFSSGITEPVKLR